ncbi:MAG: hypothetical protein HDT07_01525 [Bacteroidales bacterium]|nr:hypothetical protein [Bacteroidales bacterium]
MFDRLVLISAACVCLVACSGADTGRPAMSSVPRPTAYPRLQLPDTATVVVTDGLPVPVRICRDAHYSVTAAENGRPPGLTVDYPSPTPVSVYFTFIPVNPANIEKTLEARRERISLNLNGAPALTTHAFGDDIEAVLVTAQTTSQTPVQLLADVDGRWIVSATSFVHDSGLSTSVYDSIRPLYDRLGQDLEQALGPLTIIKSRR